MKKCLSIFILFFLGFIGLSLSANAGFPAPEPINTYHGIGMKEGSDSIHLESTLLNFYIASLGENDDNENRLEMCYTLKNETDSPHKQTFYLPVENSKKDIERIQISTQKENIQPTLRYSYLNPYQSILSNLSGLREEYNEEGFYKKNLSVHHYTFELSNLPSEQRLEVQYKYSFDSAKTNLFTNSLSSYSMAEKRIGIYAASQIDFYFVGDDVSDPLLDLKVYNISTGMIESNVGISLAQKEELTFEEFAFLEYNPDSGISHMDYYNAIVEKLSEASYSINGIRELEVMRLRGLQAWLQYDLYFSELESLINKISLPISGYRDYSGFLLDFSFEFLSFFKNPGKMDIHIVTEFNFSNSNFIEVEDGYLQSNVQYDEAMYFSLSLQYSYEETLDRLDQYITIFFLYILYILPVVGLLIFFFVDKKRFQRNTAYLTLFLMYNVGYAGFLSILFSYFFYVSYALLIVSMGFLIFELFGLKKNSLIQFIGSCALWCISTIFLCLGEISTAGVICFMLGAILTIYFFVHLLRYENDITSNGGNTQKKERYLAVGYLSMKEFVVTVILMVVVLAIVCFISGLLYKILPSYICFFICMAILLPSFLGIIYGKAMRDSREFRQFFKDLDINQLEKALEKKLSHPKLHPETKNYYYILFASYALVYQRELYEAYEEKIFVPKNKTFRRIYDFSRLHILLPKDEFEAIASKLRKNYYNKRGYLRKLDQFIERAKPLYQKKNTVSIDVLYKKEKKNPFEKAIDLFILIYVYRNQGEETKARALEEQFKKDYAQMKVLVERLEQTEEREEKKEL